MSAGLPVDPLIGAGAVLLLLGVMVAGLGHKLRIPGALLFLGIGMLVGDDGLGLITLDDPELVQNVGILALVVILFEGGLTTKPSDLRRSAAPGFALATLGVLITAGVTGLGVVLVLDVEPLTAFIVGAVVASTDAAAVFDMLRKTYLPRRLSSILSVESGANDPIAIMLTIGLLETWAADPTVTDWVVFGVTQLAGGLAIGGLIGVGAALLLRRLSLGTGSLYPIMALAAAALAYGAAVPVGGSGFLAVYVCGLIVGANVPRRRRLIRDFHAGLANAADIGLFLLLGLLVFPSELPGVALPALAVVAVLTFVARPVAVLLCTLPGRYSTADQALVAWAGLRGAVPIVLSTFPFTAGYPGGEAIFNVVFFVVLLSTLLQGSTITPLVRRLGLEAPQPAWAPVAEAIPVDAVGTDLVELHITSDLEIAGQRLKDVPLEPGMLLSMIVRGDRAIVPAGETRLEDGDLAIVAVDLNERPHAVEQLTAWARGEESGSAPGGEPLGEGRRGTESPRTDRGTEHSDGEADGGGGTNG